MSVDHQEWDYSVNTGIQFLLLCSPSVTAEAAAIQGPGEEVRKKKGVGTCRPGNFNLMLRFCLPR